MPPVAAVDKRGTPEEDFEGKLLDARHPLTQEVVAIEFIR